MNKATLIAIEAISLSHVKKCIKYISLICAQALSHCGFDYKLCSTYCGFVDNFTFVVPL